jgi:hypothetical protein
MNTPLSRGADRAYLSRGELCALDALSLDTLRRRLPHQTCFAERANVFAANLGHCVFECAPSLLSVQDRFGVNGGLV